MRATSTTHVTPAPGQSGHDVPDEELVRRAQRHAADFAPLYERYVDAIYGYCVNRTGNLATAEDLTSRIFTQAIAALPRFTGETSSFRTWLFAIAHNVVVDSYRRQRPIDPLADAHQSSDPTPDRVAEQRELRDAFAHAMTQLNERQRDVVALRLAGLTGPEIAVTTGMTLSAVKSIQFRAYANLRTLLAPFRGDAYMGDANHE